MQRVLFNEIPNSDEDENFLNNMDHAGGKRNKEGLAAPPVPIFRKKKQEEKLE